MLWENLLASTFLPFGKVSLGLPCGRPEPFRGLPKNPAYEKVKGQKELRTRYILEDIPYGLVPMIELGRMQGLSMNRMDVIARLGQFLLRDDCFIADGRTLAQLGVDNMSSDQFLYFIETGERQKTNAARR